MHIRNRRPTPEEVDCRYCTEYFPNVGCEALDCIILPERIAAGVVGYEEIVANSFYYNPELIRRLQKLIKNFPGTMWADELHEQRFNYCISQCEETFVSPAYYAAVYLLTSNDDLYKRSSRCFLKSRLYLRDFRIQGISPYNYTLFAYARLLYSGKNNLPMTELVDGWTVPPEAFRFIVNAVIIAKHGVETLNITKTTTIKDTETEE